MYTTDPTRTATVQYTPRQWVQFLLEPQPMVSDHLKCYVLTQVQISDHYPGDRIAVSATPLEATVISSRMREYKARGY